MNKESNLANISINKEFFGNGKSTTPDRILLSIKYFKNPLQ